MRSWNDLQNNGADTVDLLADVTSPDVNDFLWRDGDLATRCMMDAARRADDIWNSVITIRPLCNGLSPVQHTELPENQIKLSN